MARERRRRSAHPSLDGGQILRAPAAISGSDLKLQDSWGVAAQLGMDVKLGERWFMTADIRYIDISSKVKLDGQRIGTARIDPWVATVGLGYRF